MPVADYLRKVDIFQDLSREEIAHLFQGIMLQECVPGTVFFTPDDSSERVFILKLGQVEVYRLTASGKRLVTRRKSPSIPSPGNNSSSASRIPFVRNATLSYGR